MRLRPQASLVASDRLSGMKKQILEGLGLATPQAFPITRDGFPLQLLSYLRLARLQDPAELAKVGLGLRCRVLPSTLTALDLREFFRWVQGLGL